MKIALLGGAGRMGQAILRSLELEHAGLKAELHFIDNVESLDLAVVAACDVWIDFSVAQATKRALEKFLQSSLPLPAAVIGTTGLNQETFKLIDAYAKHAPILQSANFSLGVLAFQECLKHVANKLRRLGFAAGIQEIHHEHKVDAPSGTALSLQQSFQGPVPCSSLRMGETIGVHEIRFEQKGETFEMKHTATDRLVFARGAIYAARRLVALKAEPKRYEWIELWNLPSDSVN